MYRHLGGYFYICNMISVITDYCEQVLLSTKNKIYKYTYVCLKYLKMFIENTLMITKYW